MSYENEGRQRLASKLAATAERLLLGRSPTDAIAQHHELEWELSRALAGETENVLKLVSGAKR
jgi:hypothetical protein